MQKRFIRQFLWQISLLSLLVFLSGCALFMTLGFYLTDSESYHNLHTADAVFFEQAITQQDGRWQLDESLKDAIVQQDGWLVLYSKTGDVLYSYNVPEHTPTAYTSILQRAPFLHTTMLELTLLNEKSFIAAYHTVNKAATVLDDVNGRIDWASDTLPALSTDASVYYLDASGTLLDVRNPFVAVMDVNAVTTLQHNAQYEVATLTDDATSRTLLVAYEQVVWDDLAFLGDFKKPFFLGLAAIFMLLLLFTWFYAKKFGAPLLILLRWIEQLRHRNYTLPTTKKGQAILHTKSGVIKRKYSLYKELFETLENVTYTLQYNEEQQRFIEKTREEWISSLSHDLKTPLSSISGYVKMLQSDYEWTKEEQQQFYAIIDEKSDYMMALIEDLTLTYRLKNGQLPLYKEPLDVNEVVRRTVIQLINRQDMQAYHFQLHAKDEPLLLTLDLKWLQRILDNLLMNAIKHNPPGTTISASVTLRGNDVIIAIEDNGVGMDDKTRKQLFNRYYRGTNTTEALEGTGLGMAITQQLILLQGGTIAVHSELGQGTRMEIMFPSEAR